jgi:NAD(P)-dependent dehydrogenase (short-subunit alcohol dehydrogenase family)
MTTKTALVTGAAAGIGEAVARMAAARGYRVGVLDRDAAAAERAAASIPGAVALGADVREPEQVERALDDLGEVPQLVVNNAGIVRFAPLLEHSLEDWKLALDINLTGTFVVARAAALRMRAHGGGSIVNLASVNALSPGSGIGAYPASKAGVVRLTEQMANEWGGFNIRVNAVAPGFIDGGMSAPIFANPRVRALRSGAVPLQRLGTCDDVAEVVLWLGSDAAAYVTGQTVAIDGGLIHAVIHNLPRD